MSYLTFVDSPQEPGKVTKCWVVKSGEQGLVLGGVSWFAHWRRYTFAPCPNIVLDATCMTELADFCQRQTDLRKAERKSA